MRRVHRNLNPDQVDTLRRQVLAQLPHSDQAISEVVRNMRLSIKHSQSEYAKLCGVAPRVLADIESGASNPTLKTLDALLLPFACGIGVVRLSDTELRRRRNKTPGDTAPKT